MKRREKSRGKKKKGVATSKKTKETRVRGVVEANFSASGGIL